MDSVLIASNSSSTMGIISDLLRSGTFSRIVTAQSSSEARRYLLENEYDLIIIDTPLTDESGEDFALHAAEKSSAGVILIVSNDSLDDVNSDVEDEGVFVVPKPVSPDFFYQSVKLLMASRRKLLKLEDENRRLQRKLEELRMVDRAKCVLIQVLKMTESQAHRYIEKQAMDQRLPRIAVAENILKIYET